MKRTALRHQSLKKRRQRPARLAAMQVVRERDECCQFPTRLALYLRGQSYDADALPRYIPHCFGELNGHEPRKLSHYPEDYTDPDRIVLLCNGHNDWVENEPDFRKLLGL